MIPGELRKGDRLTADWLNALVREAVARALSAGPGIRITRTPSGSTISSTARARPGRGGLGEVSAKVVRVGSGSYSDGMYSGTDVLSGDSVRFCLPVWSQTSELPSGTRILALEVESGVTGGWS